MRLVGFYVPPAPFRRLWASEAARVFGGQLLGIVLPWIYLRVVHSPETYGFLITLTSIPRVVGSASSAWWNKRGPAVAVMRRASSVAALMAAGVALAVSFARTDLWIMMPFIIVMAFTEGVYFPAVGTAVPQLLPEESWQQANALIQGTNQVGRMVASFVLAPVVTKVAYWASCAIVAALYLVTSLVLPTSRPRPAADGAQAESSPSEGGADESESEPTSDAKSRSFWRNPAFLILLGLTLGINLGYLGPTTVGIPLFVSSALHGNASIYALMVGCEAAGSLAGMLLLTFTSRSRVSVHLLLGGLYVGTLFWLLIPLYPHVAWCACLMALSMAAFVWVNIQSISLIQIWFRGSSLASVMSILWTAAIVLGPVSYAVDGALLKWLSIQVLFIASACLIAFVVTMALICILVRPTWIPQQAKASEVA
ncbi:MFS transporter [Alicyclobacillus sendaiensis]|uniref:MFS transporter n=1 Tax=Alicyclobacillus sendaiensis PA2 TaxID=3029425 RepID=A0ABT6XWZ0_ALISE|nr:MFS transporter [Alicyclobacillus sendaiensis]MDI9259617.1 MFS transporter [Alicyclobacillus sendaiensis PA2]